MFNILLDELPDEWNGYKLDMDFQTGIQISQCLLDEELNKMERFFTACRLMFLSQDVTLRYEQLEEAIKWYLNGWNPDISKKKSSNKEPEVMDFDIDQWRIYAAFQKHYHIDLNTAKMHFWVFMGLLSNLEECNFTRVIEIRSKKVTSKMTAEEKKSLQKAKEMYRIRKTEEADNQMIEEQREEIEAFNRLRNRK